MQVVNGRLVVLLAAAGRAGEHFLKTRLRLPLPAADLVRMYFVLARDHLDRAVPAQRFGRYLGFELRCESASFRRHPLGPPHGLVYTLTSCPFFRDHLKLLVEGKVEEETRYYISSLPGDAKQIGHAVRSHWGVENGLHWVMDMVFRDDECRIRSAHAPANFATIKHMASNLLRRGKGKHSMRASRHIAGWDEDFLYSLLTT